jgi:hypothetical protein
MAYLPVDGVGTQIDRKGFAARLWRFREDYPQYWDIKIHSVDGKIIPASRKDLAAFSPVLAGMFASQLREAQTGILNVGWSSKVMESLLDVCYGGEV